MPARKYWLNEMPGATVAGERRAEDDQQQHREEHREERGLAVADERLELDADATQPDRPGAGQSRAGRGRGRHGVPPC